MYSIGIALMRESVVFKAPLTPRVSNGTFLTDLLNSAGNASWKRIDTGSIVAHL